MRTGGAACGGGDLRECLAEVLGDTGAASGAITGEDGMEALDDPQVFCAGIGVSLIEIAGVDLRVGSHVPRGTCTIGPRFEGVVQR